MDKSFSEDPVSRQINNVTLEFRMENIVNLEVEAVVNAAQPYLSGGGGVDGAIHAAGGPRILKERKIIYGLRRGAAIIKVTIVASFIFSFKV